MNKALIIFILFLSIVFFQSCQNCNTYYHSDPVVVSCMFKIGSYFVYNDSTDHIIDSEYVYQYTYHINGVELTYEDNCLTYGDVLSMSQLSFHNGSFYDKIYSDGSAPPHFFLYDSLRYDYSFPGWTFALSVLSNFSVSNNIYPTVYKDSSVYGTLVGTDTIPTDLYFAPNYGIVKKVEHRPTGDVSWDLIRYHIAH
jgi:hypothetical protein